MKQLLRFEDVAAELECDDNTVRSLVVEERSLPAIYVTRVGCKEPFSGLRLLHVGVDGMAFDLTDSNNHCGYVRVERADLNAFKTKHGLDVSIQAKKRGHAKALGARAETSYLTIIGALLELVRTPRKGRDSDAAVIRELIENYSEKPGISKSNLEAKFAEARRRLNST